MASSGSSSGWNKNSLIINVLSMMQSEFVFMYDFLIHNLGLGNTSTDGVYICWTSMLPNHGLKVFFMLWNKPASLFSMVGMIMIEVPAFQPLPMAMA